MIRRMLSESNLEAVYAVFDDDGSPTHIEVDHYPSQRTYHYDEFVSLAGTISHKLPDPVEPVKVKPNIWIISSSVAASILVLVMLVLLMVTK